MSAHNIYGFNGTEAACTCSPRIWRPSADFMAHAARAAERALVEQVKAVLAGVPHSDGCYVPLRRACDCWQADLRSALRPEAATTEEAVTEPLGSVILGISNMIDSTYPADLDPEAHLLRRCIKITEEAGEVIEALFGALGENPRKGQTHTMDDVRRELLDVALAALAAIAHFDTGDSIDYLQSHATHVYDRLDSVLAARPSSTRGEGRK